jgi:hypothetical protein
VLKKNPQVRWVLVAAFPAAWGIVQYLGLSGLISLSIATRIHWLFLPAYGIGGAFGVMLQWFLIAALSVVIMSQIDKRKREGEPGVPDGARPEAPAPAKLENMRHGRATFGRKPRA